eukprot:6282260-Prymnesium_polylepis.1
MMLKERMGQWQPPATLVFAWVFGPSSATSTYLRVLSTPDLCGAHLVHRAPRPITTAHGC